MEKEGIFNNIFCEALIPTTDKNTAREGQTSIPHELTCKNSKQIKQYRTRATVITKWSFPRNSRLI